MLKQVEKNQQSCCCGFIWGLPEDCTIRQSLEKETDRLMGASPKNFHQNPNIVTIGDTVTFRASRQPGH